MGDSKASPSFGSLLRSHRLNAGLTQELLAERSGVAKRTLQDLELGATRPRRETVRRLIAALAPTPEARSQFEAVASAPRRRHRLGHGADAPAPSHDAPGSASDVDARGPTAALPQGLIPTSLTRFIGRERELAELHQLLATRRLLTLTGPGGSGKTRLALELVARVQSAYPDGVSVVSLASLANPGQVGSTIAAGLRLQEVPGESRMDTLVRFIGEKTMLLLLDNFEHLVPAGPLLITLLSACPMLTVLVTSREVLRLRGEQTYAVPSLTVPASSLPLASEDAVSVVSESEAVRLFVDRARSAQPSFRLDTSNVVAVAEICVRLDGLPLAIELAAARVRHLTPELLRARLEHRLPLLTGGGYDMPVRQRSLRGAIAWSYDLLSAPEQRLFQRLGVFVGGFTLDAAETVCGRGADESPADEIGAALNSSAAHASAGLLDLLGSLVEKSLVVQVRAADAQPRYTMLETIRGFALELLAAAGEEATLRQRHRDWCLALAEEADRYQKAANQGHWLDRLEAEHHNLRAGLTWCIACRDVSDGLRLGAALWWFWYIRSHCVEGRDWYRRLLWLDQDHVRSRERAEALFGAGQLALEQGDYAEAQLLGEESLAIGQALGLLQCLGSAHMLLGTIARARGDYVTARTQLQASLAARREVGSPGSISVSLGSLGSIALGEGDYAQARVWCEQALTLARGCGDLLQTAKLESQLGEIALETMEIAAARRHYEQSLAIAREIGDDRRLAYSLEGFAAVAAAEGSFERCLMLVGAAQTLREKIGIPLQWNEQSRWASRFDPARRALWEARAGRLLQDGRSMTTDQAIRYARDGAHDLSVTAIRALARDS